MRSCTARTISRCLRDGSRLPLPTAARVLPSPQGSVCPSCSRVTQASGRVTLGARPFSSLISPDNIVRSPFPDEDIPNVNFAQYVLEMMQPYAKLTATVDVPTGRSYTYSELQEAAIKVASAITRLGYTKGDVIAIFSANVPEYCILILAAAWCGIVVTPANPSYTAGELARQLEMSKARAVFTIAPLLPTVKEALSSSPILQKTVKDLFALGEVEGCRPVSELMKDDGAALPQNVNVNPKDDVLLLPFSSGTTGLPKGVMLTHHNCVANLKQIRKPLTVDQGNDNFIGVLPFYHIYGMIPVQFGALQDGATLYTMPRFDPEMFLTTLQKHKISILHVVPPIVLFLAKHPVVSKFDLSNLKYVICGAAPLGEGLTSEFQNRLKAPVYQGYGLTEASPVINVDTAPGQPGSIGHVVPNTTVKIQCPETGKTLGKGELGEYCAKGPQMMKGYLNDPDSTAAMLDKDGWLHTGDLGYLQEDGRVVIEDRLKELIKYKGFQVPPAELEAFLLTHPGVQDVGVIGVPKEGVGELPRAYVVKKPDSSVSKEEIAKFVEDNMASYKSLRGGVEFIEEIPKSPSGKILRRVLKDNLSR
ncbi:uncharacterized protein [Haliotis cracherodii]|uniref:uncharacterized protein n=1 Tax=Haliotis cracherodii TaxID=6455 RepID=UPI0039E9C97B